MNIRAAVSPVMNQMKTRKVLFAGAVAVALGMMPMAPVASAQDAVSQVNIPFAFSANHQELPAGHYRVLMEAENVLRLVSYETGNSAGFVVHSARSLQTSPKNSLVFLHDERGYELTTVRFGQGSVQTEATLQSKPGEEIVKNASKSRSEIGMR
jgi:hypothetical protein